MRHLLSIEDLDRRGIERILDRAKSFTEVSEREETRDVVTGQVGDRDQMPAGRTLGRQELVADQWMDVGHS